MRDFFPRSAIDWRTREAGIWRRAALSLVGMAVGTGVIVHLYRDAALAGVGGGAGAPRWWVLLAWFAGWLILLLGPLTLYLGNHTVREWIWRAPLFAVVESVTEAVVSAGLIALGVERFGTALATWHDWPRLSLAILAMRLAVIIVYAVVLGAVVQVVRMVLLGHEHRLSTVAAIHEEAEHEAREP